MRARQLAWPGLCDNCHIVAHSFKMDLAASRLRHGRVPLHKTWCERGDDSRRPKPHIEPKSQCTHSLTKIRNSVLPSGFFVFKFPLSDAPELTTWADYP